MTPGSIRLIEHLRGLGMTNRQAKEALATGKVFFHDAPTGDPTRVVETGAVSVRPQAPRAIPYRDPAVIYRDEELLVVVKPSGMLSVPAPKRRERSVFSVLAKHGEVHVVHRLDEGTSGLMVFARTEGAQEALKGLLEDHAIEREYAALVWGQFPREEQRVESVLVRNRGDGKRGSSDEPDADGKRAVTHLALVEHISGKNSLVRARLETGRTHQVRIHLAEAGHPVMGDALYGRPGRSRLALHSQRLRFRFAGRDFAFYCPLADDLEKLRASSPASRRPRR